MSEETVIDLCSDSGESSSDGAREGGGASGVAGGEPRVDPNGSDGDTVISIGSSSSEESRGVPSVITTRRESDEGAAAGIHVSGSSSHASAPAEGSDDSMSEVLDRPVFSGRPSVARRETGGEEAAAAAAKSSDTHRTHHDKDASPAAESSAAVEGSPGAQQEEELFGLVERNIASAAAKESAIIARRNRRRADGYDLKEGERMVWATEIEGGESHQAIILHPQPDPPSSGLVRIEWFSTNTKAWIPSTQINGDVNGAGDDDSGEETGDTAKNPRRRKRANRGCIKRYSEEEFADPYARRRRKTCFTNVVYANNTKRQASKLLTLDEIRAIATVNGTSYQGSWWGASKDEQEPQPPAGDTNDQDEVVYIPNAQIPNAQIPNAISLSNPSGNDAASIFSELTRETKLSDCNTDTEAKSGSDINNTAREVTPLQHGCHICQSQLHHHCEMNNLLNKFRELPVNDGDKLMDAMSRFQRLIQGMEGDCFDGPESFFFHTCSSNDAPNPVFTVAKLVQLFDCVCQRIPKMLQLDESAANDANVRLLFDPCKKKNLSCGIVLQVVRMATFELVNSREDFVTPEDPGDLDRLMGVTFGLQLLQSMARNAHQDAKRQSAECAFLENGLSLESNTKCIKRNCQVDRRAFVRCKCKTCGVRIHKKCLHADERDNLVDECPTCNASSMLVDAARVGNLSDVYSLVVEKGASPFLVYQCETTGSHETALHTAVRRNQYDLASMLLYGSYVMLTCDDELAKWNLPEIAWGRDDNLRSPFRFGLDLIKGSLFVRPPVESLLLLCGRGAKETRDDIKQALQIRQSVTLVNKGLELTQTNLQTELQSDISIGLEPTKIPFAGDGKSSYSLPSFMYVAKSVETRSTAIRWFDCRIGRKQLTPFAEACTANSLKLLHQQQSIPSSWKSYCNYLCESRSRQTKQCECQVAENGFHYNVEVFETPDGRGLGVRTAKGSFIAKNSILCHYSGEIIASEEAAARDKEYAKSHAGSYIIDVDEKGQFCIDATQTRSVAALINHACSESNCELYRALGNHLDANFPFVGLRAKEDIGELTELTFNYGQKPTGLCSHCDQWHCLCPQCKVLAHEKL